jgi:hypothetical protein
VGLQDEIFEPSPSHTVRHFRAKAGQTITPNLAVKQRGDQTTAGGFPVNPWISRRMHSMVAALFIRALPPFIRAQQPTRVPRAPGTATHDPVSLAGVSRAIDLSAHYLESACGENGKFAYRLDPNSGQLSSSYNIVRHAGAMYALAMLNGSHPDRKAVDATVRAAAFMRANYIGSDARSNALVVWSRPLPTRSDAGLGATGLGLVALTGLDQVEPSAVPLADLEGLGRFIVFLQRSDGSFTSKYSPGSGPVTDWDSLYYPGEAALGLISLYGLDHRGEWLAAAGKALAYLASSRARVQEMPPDHWAVIATARFLPHCRQGDCAVSRAELIEHAGRICDRFLRDQVGNPTDARLAGGFDAAGRTTPSAIRLEGLLAALEFLPDDASGRRARIEAAVERGIAFLLRAQITSGPYAGGMPAAVSGVGSIVVRADPRTSDIRIDYVQHALSAWLRYQKMVSDSAERRRP